MEYPVIVKEETIGSCRLEQQGLYWELDCTCTYHSGQVERLYCGTRKIGVLEPRGDQLRLQRKLAQSAWPELPPQSGVFSLEPLARPEPWKGDVLGFPLEGIRVGNHLLFPYDPQKPCPCEPLFCFFSVEDGFWKLPLPPTEST